MCKALYFSLILFIELYACIELYYFPASFTGRLYQATVYFHH